MSFELVNTILYTGEEGSVSVELNIDTENYTMWASQKIMSELFNVKENTITYHLKNIFKENELDENSVTRKIRVTASDGKKYNTKFFNLDAIISVGYRVNSKQATHFRRWATKILKEYMVKGFVLDEELLKNNGRFGVSYFPDLLEKIREIRSSERLFNQKLTDIYATSYDYNPQSQITKDFFATVQNTLIFAVSNQTAAEIIITRSDKTKPHMG